MASKSDESELDIDAFPYYFPQNNFKALVVDSDPFSLSLQENYFHLHGVNKRGVKSGEEALGLLAAGKSYHIVAIEMLLPFMNGIETVRRIRNMGVRSKIIGVTGVHTERHREAFMAAGIDMFIPKTMVANDIIPILLEMDRQRGQN